MLRMLCRLLVFLALLPLAGCVFGTICRCSKSDDVNGTPGHADDLLRPMQRGGNEPGYHALPVPLTLQELQKHEKPVPHYRGLTAFECQCLAATTSSVGNLLDEERKAVSEHDYWCPKAQRLASLKEAILLHAALEARNQSAGAALELYYRLGEAEARWELLQESIREIDSALVHTKDLARQGIRVQIDVDEMLRQRLAAQAEATQLQLVITQLNSDLRRLLNFEECHDEWRFWPCIDFNAPVETVCMETAVSEGLSRRPQLKLLRSLPDDLDARTLPAVQALLKSFNGLLGMSEPRQKSSLLLAFLSAADRTEVEKSRRQLNQYREERERTIAQDIQQSVRTVHAQIELVVLARERVRIRRARLANLEGKQAKGITPFSDILTARLELIRARDEAIKEVTALKLAQVKLKQDQGVLAAECGCGNDIPADHHDKPTEADDTSDQKTDK